MKFKHNFPADGEYRFTIAGSRRRPLPARGRDPAHAGDAGGRQRSVPRRRRRPRRPGDRRSQRRPRPRGDHGALRQHSGAGEGRRARRRRHVHRARRGGVGRIRRRLRWVRRRGRRFGRLRVPRLLEASRWWARSTSLACRTRRAAQKIFVCEPTAAERRARLRRRIAENLARRAFRRPGGSGRHRLPACRSTKRAARRRRLRRWHRAGGRGRARQPRLSVPRDPAADRVAGLHPRMHSSDLELASRLSFFLWSQGPDDELLDARGRRAS